MSAPSYHDYKASGIGWLGEVPSHWTIEKFRHRFRESAEKIEADVVGPMLSVSGYRGIKIKEYDDENRRRRDDELVGYRIVRPGQLVVNTMWLNYAGLGVSAHEGHVSPAYRSYWIRPGLEGRYAHHLMRSSIYVKGYTRLLTGIRPNSLQMSRDDLMEFPVILPPPAEQSAIAAFLDRETAKIDALVEAQARLIELLKEKRQAVISHAVTKGLDRAAPMKDSGVEWLGQVPAHWEVRKIKQIAQMESGHTPDRKIAAYWEDCDIPWVSLHDTGHLKDHDYISETAQSVNPLGLANSSARLLPARAVVFSRDATIGRCAITTRPMAVSQHFIAWLCSDDLEPEYLLFCLRSMAGELDRLSSGATLKTIGMPQVRALAMPLPSRGEQLSIVTAIQTKAVALDAMITDVQAAMTLLQERRAALISAAVTGKIDVRGLALEQAEAA